VAVNASAADSKRAPHSDARNAGDRIRISDLELAADGGFFGVQSEIRNPEYRIKMERRDR
jgi:hypothetical protein